MTSNIKVYLEYFLRGLLIIATLSPLVVLNNTFFPYIVGKAFVFRSVVEIAFAVWLVLAILDEKYRPKLSLISLSVLGFLFVTLISAITGVDQGLSLWSSYERMEGWVTILHLGLLFLIVGHSLKEKKDWLFLFNVSLVGSVMISITGISQWFEQAIAGNIGFRADSLTGNPIYLAIYSFFHLFFALILITKNTRNKTLVWLYSVVAVLNFFAIFVTQTRGTVLGLIGAIGVMTFLYAIFGKEYPRTRKFSIAILVAVIVLIGSFFFLKDKTFIKENPILGRYANISTTEGSSYSRLVVWNIAWQGIKEKPVFGWGQENFSQVFNKYYDIRMYQFETWYDRAHNVFIDWAVASGFVGLFFYLALYASSLFLIWRRKTDFDFIERVLVTGIFVGYAIHGLFVFDSLVSYLPFFFLLAYVHFNSSKIDSSFDKVFEKILQKVGSKNVEGFVAPIIILIAFASVYYLNVTSYQANRSLIDALSANSPEKKLQSITKALKAPFVGVTEARERLVLQNGFFLKNQTKKETLDKYINLAISEGQDELSQRPSSVRFRLVYSGFLNELGRFDESINLMKETVALAPKKQIVLVQLGFSYLADKNYKEALAVAEEAYNIQPNFSPSKDLYITSLIYAGNFSKAKEIIGNVQEYSQNVINALIATKNYKELVAQYEKRIQNDPKLFSDYISLSTIYYKTGFPQKSIKILNDLNSNLKTVSGLPADEKTISDQLNSVIELIKQGKADNIFK